MWFNVQDGMKVMKRLFDPNKSHLSVWIIWVYDPKDPRFRHQRSERPEKSNGVPFHYASFNGRRVKFLIVEHSQGINA
jgi:hypothetical protein